jgi:hypothetical protein
VLGDTRAIQRQAQARAGAKVAPRRGVVGTRVFDEIDPLARKCRGNAHELVRRERGVEVDAEADVIGDAIDALQLDRVEAVGRIGSRPVARRDG